MVKCSAAVIVNWNGSAFLPGLLSSLEKEQVGEIVVVDNASADDSVALLTGRPGIRLVANAGNVGFGRAANQGIQLTTLPYVLILNADTELLPGSVATLETFLDGHPEAGIVAPRLVFPDLTFQKSCRAFPTIHGMFLYLSFLDRVLPSDYRPGERDHQAVREVDQPMAAAMMTRRKALDEVGMFDPDFPLFMEDVDLCERIKKGGWKIYYLPDASVIHHAGGSTGQDWQRSQRQFVRSLVLYFRKRSSRFRVGVLKCSLSLALLLRAFILLLSRRRHETKFWLGQAVQVFSI